MGVCNGAEALHVRGHIHLAIGGIGVQVAQHGGEQRADERQQRPAGVALGRILPADAAANQHKQVRVIGHRRRRDRGGRARRAVMFVGDLQRARRVRVFQQRAVGEGRVEAAAVQTEAHEAWRKDYGAVGQHEAVRVHNLLSRPHVAPARRQDDVAQRARVRDEGRLERPVRAVRRVFVLDQAEHGPRAGRAGRAGLGVRARYALGELYGEQSRALAERLDVAALDGLQSGHARRRTLLRVRNVPLEAHSAHGLDVRAPVVLRCGDLVALRRRRVAEELVQAHDGRDEVVSVPLEVRERWHDERRLQLGADDERVRRAPLGPPNFPQDARWVDVVLHTKLVRRVLYALGKVLARQRKEHVQRRLVSARERALEQAGLHRRGHRRDQGRRDESKLGGRADFAFFDGLGREAGAL